MIRKALYEEWRWNLLRCKSIQLLDRPDTSKDPLVRLYKSLQSFDAQQYCSRQLLNDLTS